MSGIADRPAHHRPRRKKRGDPDRAGFVFLCQDVFPEVTQLIEGFRSRRVDAVLERVSSSLVRGADRVVAVGETMRDLLIERRGADPSRVTVVHNWADCSAIMPRPKDTAFAREHGLRDSFVVMHSGNVGLSQNLDTLLDAAALLHGERGIVFVVMGDGARRPALEARARAQGQDQVRSCRHQPTRACRRFRSATSSGLTQARLAAHSPSSSTA